MKFDFLLEKISYEEPIIAVYDTDDTDPFTPLVAPIQGKHSCCFAFYQSWKMGKTLDLTPDNHGCPGAGVWCFDIRKRDREDFIHFLADEEGLKASHEIMGAWLDVQRPYKPKHKHLLIGPYRTDLPQTPISLSFIINPDQLSLLITGATYHAHPADPAPVTAPFGSGCSQLLSQVAQYEHPAAVIGGTDIAMRQYLAPDKLVFTVNMPMAERLARLDEKSFLTSPFHERLKKARRL